MTQPGTVRLWVVRHAAPLIEPGRCYGRLEVPADPAATAQAAAALAQALPAQVRVHASPAQRCRALADALARLRPGLAARPDPRLHEMDFGTWEGQAWDTIGPARMDAWVQDFAHHAPGGGESLAAMLARVAAALHDACSGPDGEVVWITHAGVARCVAWLLQHPPVYGLQGPALQTLQIDARDWPVHAPAWGAWQTHPLCKPMQQA